MKLLQSTKNGGELGKTSLRIMVVLIVLLMAVPMVPAEVLVGPAMRPGGLVGERTVDIEPPAVRLTGTRNPDPISIGPSNVNGATSINPARHVVRTSNNTIYVVYENNSQIYFSRSTNNGASFSTPISISNDTRTMTYITTPAIATNGTAIFVVWSVQDTNWGNVQEEFIAFRRSNDGGNTWTPALNQPATKLPHAATSLQRRMYPAVAVNNTTVYVVATNYNNDDVYFYMSLDSGTSWNPAAWGVGNTELLLNANAGEPTISVSNESVYIAYTYWPAGSNDIGYIYSNNGRNILFNVNQFSAVQDLYAAGSSARYANIASIGTNVYVVWQEPIGGGGDEVYFRNTTNQGGVWSPALAQVPARVSNSTGNARNPSITVLSNTSQFCSWRDSSFNGNYDLVYAERANNAWGEPFFLSNNTNGTSWPSAAEKIKNNRLDIVWTNGTAAFDVMYDGIYVGGSAPSLDWTGENSYVTDGVNPDNATTGHTYIYRVEYTDADNEAPKAGYPRVWIDKNLDGDYYDAGEQVAMNEVNPGDTTYSDGKLYTYSTRLKFLGLYSYQFKALDINGRPATGTPTVKKWGPNITSFNEPPVLFWLSDTNYITDGLDPETGFTDTDFTYKIMYFDLLNESPAANFPKVYIDMDNNGVFTDPADTQTAMAAVNPADTSYDNGKIYTYTTKLPLGTYRYMFYTEDLVGLSAITENRTGPTVIPKGSAPVLALTGETGYTTNGVEPDTGTDSTQFVYRVRYSDADGDMPAVGYPKVGIDINEDGFYAPAEKFVMTEDDPLDLDVIDGKIYTYDFVFGKLGTFAHMFEAMDTNVTPALPINYTGPTVDISNVPPVLEWLGSGGFVSDGLDPEEGTAGTTRFFYTVIYKDQDGNPPMTGYPKIWIDQNLDGIEQTGEWSSMTDANASNTDYTGGKRYNYNTTFAAVGTYKYKFEALDSLGSPAPGTNLPTILQNGPVVSALVNLNPRLTLLGAGDYNGTGVFPALGGLSTPFVYKVNYIDAEGDMPGVDWPRVYIDSNGDGIYTGPSDKLGIMAEDDAADTDVTDGKVYVYTTTLPLEGDAYAYKFKAKDANGNLADGTGTIFDLEYKGPKVAVNKAPTLQFLGTGNFMADGVDPETNVAMSNFTYRVVYKDLDGDKPLDGKVVLRLDLNRNKAIETTEPAIVMTEANAADTNYADGKEYTAIYKFTEAGTYGYMFESSDLNGEKAVGAASVDYIAGPIVTPIPPNVLPTLGFTGETDYVTDGVNPLTALKSTKFVFRVRYFDLDNDAPATGSPTLTIDGQTYTMTAVDASDTNYVDGKIYTVEVTLTQAKTYTYTFNVKNVLDQTAVLGPLDGPVVTKKAPKPAGAMLPDFLWIILLIIIAIVVLIIGFLAGSRRKKEPEPMPEHRRHQRPETRAAPPRRVEPVVPLDKADVEYEEPTLETPKEEPQTEPAEEPKDEPPVEPKQEPQEAPGPPPAADEKADMKGQQSASEAPADDKVSETPKAESKEEGHVDQEIDSILSKLD